MSRATPIRSAVTVPRALLVAFACTALFGVALAADTAPPASVPPSESTPATPATPATPGAPSPATPAGTPPAATPAGEQRESGDDEGEDRVEPGDRGSADNNVSFPVDI